MRNDLNLCENCLKLWRDDELEEIDDIWERVSPGEPMPSGECPECGALCQPDTVDSRLRDAAKDLLEACKAAFAELNWYWRGAYDSRPLAKQLLDAIAKARFDDPSDHCQPNGDPCHCHHCEVSRLEAELEAAYWDRKLHEKLEG